VLVVDDGGGIDLRPSLQAVEGSLDVRIVGAPHGGPAAARNAGAREARGDFLAFTDDDCVADPGWLRAFEGPLREEPGHLLGGLTRNGLPDNAWSSASQSLLDYLYGYYNAVPEDARFFASNNIAIGKARFEELGGFDVTFPLAAGEDRDLCDRQRHLGGRLVSVPGAVVTHRHHLGPVGFLRQHFNYGRGARRFHEVRALRRGERLHVEPLQFYVDLLRHPFRASRGSRALALAFLTLLAQVANVAGFVRGAPGRRE
jgi:GT2 family glycosyltransferase